MTESGRKYFGLTEEQLLEKYRNCEDPVDRNGRIDSSKTTLEQLSEASKDLIRENGVFLTRVYNSVLKGK